MTSRLQDFNSELWQKWASMGVIFLACGAMLYQDHATPRPRKHSCSAPVPSSHKKSTSARRSKGAYMGHYSRLPLTRYQIYRLLLVFIALFLVGIFVVYSKSHRNARADYNAQRYNMMPPS
ncbi:hypothetical protein M758_1G298200 [Ceratodon purpureus]|uniref:Transmembrane protein n=1 Tax=Ceratodon purpureus TaxID=3225 RepID=A0A8T0JDL1_CERPU|nr:hypothetical protein KC19_1G305100 [Ceratodon purpureus]KAG0632017.1 hypothetical protein M758_1G298200 [Ceratodon purpureus]